MQLVNDNARVKEVQKGELTKESLVVLESRQIASSSPHTSEMSNKGGLKPHFSGIEL